MLESKIALRRELTNRSVTEKLAMLDALRERALALRQAAESMYHPGVHETPAKYHAGRNKEKRSKS